MSEIIFVCSVFPCFHAVAALSRLRCRECKQTALTGAFLLQIVTMLDCSGNSLDAVMQFNNDEYDMWWLCCLSGSIKLHICVSESISFCSELWSDFVLLNSLQCFPLFSVTLPGWLLSPFVLLSSFPCHPFAFPTILATFCSPVSPLSPSLCLPVSSGRDVRLGRCLRRSLLSQTVHFPVTRWNSQIWVLSCKNSQEENYISLKILSRFGSDELWFSFFFLCRASFVEFSGLKLSWSSLVIMP